MLLIQMALDSMKLGMLDEVVDRFGFRLSFWKCWEKGVCKELNDRAVHRFLKAKPMNVCCLDGRGSTWDAIMSVSYGTSKRG
jgi:hypothetical protein